MAKDFSYTVGDVDEVIDERGNVVIMLRTLAWGAGKEKLELRKWFVDVDKETPSKGVTFLTEEGPSNLTTSLLGLGYGDTEECIKTMEKRDDFYSALEHVIGKTKITKAKETINEKETYYDPKELMKDE